MIESPRISLSRAHRHFILWGWKGEGRGGREGRGGVNGQIVSIQMRREVDDTSPSALISPFLPTFGACATRASPREDLNFRIRFLSRVAQGFAGSAGDGKRNEIPEGETVSEWARARAFHCRPLVYEPGVRFRRGDSILFATIYSAKDRRARINYGRYLEAARLDCSRPERWCIPGMENKRAGDHSRGARRRNDHEFLDG